MQIRPQSRLSREDVSDDGTHLSKRRLFYQTFNNPRLYFSENAKASGRKCKYIYTLTCLLIKIVFISSGKKLACNSFVSVLISISKIHKSIYFWANNTDYVSPNVSPGRPITLSIVYLSHSYSEQKRTHLNSLIKLSSKQRIYWPEFTNKSPSKQGRSDVAEIRIKVEWFENHLRLTRWRKHLIPIKLSLSFSYLGNVIMSLTFVS